MADDLATRASQHAYVLVQRKYRKDRDGFWLSLDIDFDFEAKEWFWKPKRQEIAARWHYCWFMTLMTSVNTITPRDLIRNSRKPYKKIVSAEAEAMFKRLLRDD